MVWITLLASSQVLSSLVSHGYASARIRRLLEGNVFNHVLISWCYPVMQWDSPAHGKQATSWGGGRWAWIICLLFAQIFSRAASTSRATCLVTVVSIWLVCWVSVNLQTPPPSPAKKTIIGSQISKPKCVSGHSEQLWFFFFYPCPPPPP